MSFNSDEDYRKIAKIIPVIETDQSVSSHINGADCHNHLEPAAAAAAAISNSCGRGTKQPAGAKFTYINVQTGNAGR